MGVLASDEWLYEVNRRSRLAKEEVDEPRAPVVSTAAAQDGSVFDPSESGTDTSEESEESESEEEPEEDSLYICDSHESVEEEEEEAKKIDREEVDDLCS